MILYHVDTETVHDVIDGLLYSIPPGEPYEVVSEFIARKLMEHKAMHGLVAVKTYRDRSGVHYDLEDAHERATEALRIADEKVIDDYVQTQTEDRLKNSKPALPPGGRQIRILKKHNVDLATYGIYPVGSAPRIDPGLQAILDQNAKLMNLLASVLSSGGIKPPAPEDAGVVPKKEQDFLADDGNQAEQVPAPSSAPKDFNLRRAPQAVHPSNPTAEDLGAQVDPETGLVVNVEPDVEDPNMVSGRAIDPLSESGNADPEPPPPTAPVAFQTRRRR